MKKIFRTLCLFACLVGAIPAAYADAWPEGTIGSGFGIQIKPFQISDEELARIASLGFHYVRFDIHWRDAETQKGRYDFSNYDDVFQKLRAHHLKAVAILNGGNPVYTGNVPVPPEKAFGYSSAPAAPFLDGDVKAFVDFSVEAVKHFGSDDIIWEIWNEPDQLAFWPPEPNPAAFARLSTDTCQAMRAVAPNAAIIGAGMAAFPDINHADHFTVASALLQSPSSSCLNAFTVHPYRPRLTPETVIEDYKVRLIPFMQKFLPTGVKTPTIISGEWGYATGVQISEDDQANYTLRILLANVIAGVPLSVIYEWRDSRPGPAPNDMEAHFGVIDWDKKDKPAAKLLTDLLPKISDSRFMERVSVLNSNCYLLRLRPSQGPDQLLAWVSNAHMASGKALSGNIPLTLTETPQLFPWPDSGKISCE